MVFDFHDLRNEQRAKSVSIETISGQFGEMLAVRSAPICPVMRTGKGPGFPITFLTYVPRRYHNTKIQHWSSPKLDGCRSVTDPRSHRDRRLRYRNRQYRSYRVARKLARFVRLITS